MNRLLPFARAPFLRCGVTVLPVACLLALAACNSNGSGNAATDPASSESATQTAATQASADAMASHDPGPGQPPSPDATDDQPRPVMQAPVILERLGFAPGVIDGEMGLSTRNARRGYQQANSLQDTGELDEATQASLARYSQISATRLVTIPADFAAGPFAPLPKDPAEQARLPGMGYTSLDEKLAERFHTTPAVLKALNPQVAGPVMTVSGSPAPTVTESATPPPVFAAGQKIRVPNVGADMIDASAVDDKAWLATLSSLGVGTQQVHADRIVVSKGKGTLSAYDAENKLVAVFTVTTGSSHDPLPLGNWKINGVDRNPKFHYNPALFWDVSDKKPKELLPPGPNGPVGVVWIDLSKPHYGIHGTPEPQTIGRAESHGCVRLTNWDAARLAQMVSPGTKVEFVA